MVRSSSVAAALAVLPSSREDAPRVIQQFTSIFLVSRFGELWRVYDSDSPGAADGRQTMPSPQSDLPHRVFVALSRKSQVRVYTFLAGEPRAVDPITLEAQLNRSALST